MSVQKKKNAAEPLTSCGFCSTQRQNLGTHQVLSLLLSIIECVNTELNTILSRITAPVSGILSNFDRWWIKTLKIMSGQIRSEGYLASNLRPLLSSSRQYLRSYNLELFNLPIHTVPHVKKTWCSGVNWESFPHYCHVMKIHKLPKYLKG